jgi:ABC-type nitrate/sulfonate/bicarbonate transport system substrate-binding protein
MNIFRPAALSLTIMAALLAMSDARANDKVRVGTPIAKGFEFAPSQVGAEVGIFQKNGIDAETIGFGGASRMHQAMAAHELDIALGSGPEMALSAKGSPELAVAAMYGAPNGLCIVVLPNSPIRTIADLRGKTIGISSLSGLTAWVAKEVGRREGWAPGELKPVSLGGQEGIVGGMLAGNVDSAVTATENADLLEEKGRLRVLVGIGEIIPDFLAHVIFASNEMIAQRPDVVRRYLKGWFETIAYMRNNKEETLRITEKLIGMSHPIAEKAYKEQMDVFSTHGRFDPQALKVVEGTFIELGFLDKPVDIKTLYTEAYLPK